MSFSTNMQKVATKLIDKYGEDITIVHRYDNVYDPTQGEDTYSEDLYQEKGKVGAYTIAEQNSDFVNVDDLKLLVKTDLHIFNEWKILYDGKEFSIISIEKTVAQDNLILYTLQIRA